MLLLLAACAAPDLAKPPPSPRPARREAKTISVNCAGGADFSTITDAVKEADSGDTVEVAPCTYAEQVAFRGRSIRIVGTGGPSVTTIVGPGEVPAVRVDDGEGPGTVLEGFTITGGGGATEPAIEQQFSMLTLRNVVISGNTGTNIVYARSAMLTLDGVTIDGTNTPSEGRIIYGRRGQLSVKDSRIACGAAPYGYVMEHGSAHLDGVTVDCPGATAALVYHCNGRVQRSVFDGLFHAENQATDQEPTRAEGSVFLGGVAAVLTVLQLDNSVVVGAPVRAAGAIAYLDSSVVSGGACGVELDATSALSSTYTDFWGNTANVCGGPDPVGTNGNLSVDPQLDADWRAAATALVDAGSPDPADNDPDGTRNDIGAYGGPFSRGGGW